MSLITSATTYDYESVSYLHEEKQRMFVWGRNIYLVQLLSAATPGMTSPVRKRVPVGQICNRLQAQMDSETGTTSTPLSPNYTPRTTKLLGGYTGFTPSVRPSVRLSVCPSVRPSRMPCPLCIIFSYGWILFILGTNDHYHERVCRAPWPLTLTYIFKVIWPWLRKSCPLCSVYSSGWILPIFGTNDHYH